MQSMSPQDRNKAILLVIAVLGVFGFAYWRVSSLAGPAPAAPAVSRVDAPIQTDPNAPLSEARGFVVRRTPDPGIDPFRSVISDTGSGFASPEPPRTFRNRPRGLGSFTGSLGDGGFMPVEAAAPPIRALGMIAGDQPVAVLLIGNQEETVRIGDRIATGAIVERISSDGVVLRQGRMREVLPMPPRS
jgi:hypothetical protein